MQYKTIVLELLEQNPELHETLRSSRILLATLDHCATMLSSRHQAWERQLANTKPGSHPSQIASEALELAVEETRACLAATSPPHGSGPLSLDEAMAFIQRRMPRD